MAEKRKSVGGPGAAPPSGVLGGTAIKPKEVSTGQAIRNFFHNPEDGTFFTRTPKSWLLITVFYCIYYFLLACFWYGMLQIFFMFLPDDRPKYTLGESIIGTNPGVGMRPRQPDVTIDSSMIKLKWDDDDDAASEDFETSSNADWAARYRQFLEVYDDTTNTTECNGNKAPAGQACRFDPAAILGDCARFPYGFVVPKGSQGQQVSPCVLLKMNRIYGWDPEPMTGDQIDEEVNREDDPMPEAVAAKIRADPNKLYLDCVGENPADREALVPGNMEYLPADAGIPLAYFPYVQAHNNYHNPLVAVRFSNMPVGQLLHIECKLWGFAGVVHSSKHRAGQVHFELMLDSAN